MGKANPAQFIISTCKRFFPAIKKIFTGSPSDRSARRYLNCIRRSGRRYPAPRGLAGLRPQFARPHAAHRRMRRSAIRDLSCLHRPQDPGGIRPFGHARSRVHRLPLLKPPHHRSSIGGPICAEGTSAQATAGTLCVPGWRRLVFKAVGTVPAPVPGTCFSRSRRSGGRIWQRNFLKPQKWACIIK